MKTGRYSGRNIYISGGSSGIGLAVAKLFASLNANVFIFARNAEKLSDAMEEITQRRISTAQRFHCAGIDVSDREAVMSRLMSGIAGFGPPHVIINSAGFAYPNYFEKIPFEKFEETIKVNLFGTWNVLSCMLPHMKLSGGHIVNVSSVAGFIGIFGYTAYSASKFGILGLSECLRNELKPYGIMVSVLCPPDTDTPGLSLENRTKPVETRAIAGDAGLMSPDQVARALVRGMNRNAFLIIPGMEGKFAHFTKHLFPGLFGHYLDHRVKKTGCRQRYL